MQLFHPDWLLLWKQKCDYLLCIYNTNNLYQIADSITGAIPLGLSFGCQLIIPSIWNKYYNFKSCIEYNDSFNQINGKSVLMAKKHNLLSLSLIYDELKNYIMHKNNIFNNIILNNNKNL